MGQTQQILSFYWDKTQIATGIQNDRGMYSDYYLVSKIKHCNSTEKLRGDYYLFYFLN